MCPAPTKTSQAPPLPYSQATGSFQTPTTAPAEGTQSQPRKRSKCKTATPLHCLCKFAAPVDCPVCGQRNMSKLKYIVGGFTHLMALSLVSTVILVWIPYCFNACKNVEHHCGNPECEFLLATFHRAPSPGNIEVHAFQ